MRIKPGCLVRYTPEGKIDDRWADWYGIVVKEIPGTASHTIVRWNRVFNTTLSIRKKDLTLINGR